MVKITNTTMNEEEQKKLMDQLSNSVKGVTQFQGACPHCGYCPHCGRSGHQVIPYNPPYNPPYGPYWTVPTIWCGTSTISGNYS